MYPTILALHSKLGKTLVGTRIRTLDSAYLYATQRDYKGAMYPWESAFVGMLLSYGFSQITQLLSERILHAKVYVVIYMSCYL